MKKTALLMASAMSLTLIVPLAACGGSGKFDLNNYINPTATTHYEGEWTSAAKVDEKYTGFATLDEYDTTPYPVVIATIDTEDENDKVLYNFETKQEVSAQFSESEPYFSYCVLLTKTDSEGNDTYDLHTYWGDTVETGINAANKPEENYYNDETKVLIDGQWHAVRDLTYKEKVAEGSEATPETKHIYFSLDPASLSDEKPTLVKYTEDQVYAAVKSVPTAGQTLDTVAATRSPFDDTDTMPNKKLTDYEYASYKNAVGGTTFVFFKDGKQQKNELVLPSNAKLISGYETTLMPIGTSVIYSVTTDVDPYATKGYNVITDIGYSATKSFVEYFRYNIKNGKTSKINADFYLKASTLSPLFNYKDECVDVASVQVVPFEKGVAHVGGSNEVTRSVFLNESGKVVCEVSGLPSLNLSLGSFTKLTDKRFLVKDNAGKNTYIVDNKVNVVASLPGTVEEKQISYSAQRIMAGEDVYRMVDFDGKVISDNLYGFVGFFNGNALVDDIEVSARKPESIDEEYADGYIVAADGTYRKLNDVFTAATEEKPAHENVNAGLCVVDTALYNFVGTKLADVTASVAPVATFTYHNCAVVTVGTENFVVTR